MVYASKLCFVNETRSAGTRCTPEWRVTGKTNRKSTVGSWPRLCKNKIPTSQISILMILDHRCCAESKHNRLIGLVLHGKCTCREFLHTLGRSATDCSLR